MNQISPITKNYLSLAAALSKADEALPKFDRSILIPLHACCGRRIAHTIRAIRSVPPFSNSAVDGYGFRFQDIVEGLSSFAVRSTLTAGTMPKPLQKGEAVSIMTGAPLPPDVDTVIMKEDVSISSGYISIPLQAIKRSMNTRLIGEDVEKGDVLLFAHTVLKPPDIGLLASQGYENILVKAPLRVGILSTGNEIFTKDTMIPAEATIMDSNRPMLVSALSFLHHEIVDLGIVPDDPKKLQFVLQDADVDVILTTGGMSVGIADHVMDVARELGEVIFHGVGIKPGRPVGCALLDPKFNAKIVLGLPGNPVAAYTCLLFVVLPIFRCLQSIPDVSRETTNVCGFSYKKRKGFREFVRVTRHTEDSPEDKRKNQGWGVLHLYGKKGAAMLSSLSQVHGFAVLSETTESVKVGDFVPFISVDEALS